MGLEADFYYVEGLAWNQRRGVSYVLVVGEEGMGEEVPIKTWAMPPAAPEKRSFAVCAAEEVPEGGPWTSTSAAESAILGFSSLFDFRGSRSEVRMEKGPSLASDEERERQCSERQTLMWTPPKERKNDN